MNFRMFRPFLPVLFYLVGILSVEAQQTQAYVSDVGAYQRGLELFDKEKYGAAQKQFLRAMQKVDDPSSEISVNSQYYAALCAVELYNKDAEYLMSRFVLEHPESPKVKKAYFQLGRYNFIKRKWKKVISWMGKVNIYDLEEEERQEYYFKLGYSYFQDEQFELAAKTLYEIKDQETRYYGPAHYYYAHIQYSSGNYETALLNFRKLEEHPKFAPIVPYYIAQIYYLQEKYDLLIGYAPELLEKASTKRAPEIARMLGESYYKQQQYAQAIPYLQRYLKEANRPSREDKYQLAYCYYREKEYSKAIEYFTKLTYTDDELCQNGLYHMGLCYMKSDQKAEAKNAFKSARKYNYDPQITEEALFNYAKLSYELSIDPYNKSIDAFKEYIDEYPESERVDEAYSYLVNVYLTTNNYSAALKSMDNMKQLDNSLKSAYQQVAYNKGVEELNNQRPGFSMIYFRKSRDYPVDRKLNALSYYWVADAYYRKKNYNKAIENYKAFLGKPGAILLPEFNSANYNIGFAYLEQKKYDLAETWFRRYVDYHGAKNPGQLRDAHLRIADSYFIRSYYNEAINHYQKATETPGRESDYALFQTAKAQGLLGKPDQKVSALENLLANFKKSDYILDSKYELGKSYRDMNQNNKALNYFGEVVAESKKSSNLRKEGLLGIGSIYYNTAQNDKALETMMTVIEDYPSYESSKEALGIIENIYIADGNVDKFIALIDELSWYDYSNAAKDTVWFKAAEKQYFDLNYDEAVASLSKYLDEYEVPVFELKARYYRAESLYNLEKYQESLKDYEHVIAAPVGSFTTASLERASQINFYYDQYAAALPQFQQLEQLSESEGQTKKAVLGQMRSNYLLEYFPSALTYADKALAIEQEDNDVIAEAHYIKAKSAFETGDTELAFEEFGIVKEEAKDVKGTEAMYYQAEIKFIREQYEDVEADIFTLINEKPSHSYWIAKSMILLADNYLAKEDPFQAKATLEVIIENYNGEELVAEARKKLDEIIKTEEEQRKKEETQGEENEFESFSPEDDDWPEFDDEEEELEELNFKEEAKKPQDKKENQEGNLKE